MGHFSCLIISPVRRVVIVDAYPVIHTTISNCGDSLDGHAHAGLAMTGSDLETAVLILCRNEDERC
jgi:hypothetical protein